jgi:hypothetical protein
MRLDIICQYNNRKVNKGMLTHIHNSIGLHHKYGESRGLTAGKKIKPAKY